MPQLVRLCEKNQKLYGADELTTRLAGMESRSGGQTARLAKRLRIEGVTRRSHDPHHPHRLTGSVASGPGRPGAPPPKLRTGGR